MSGRRRRVSLAKPRLEVPSPALQVDAPPRPGLVLRTPRMVLRALRPSDRSGMLAAARATREALDALLPLHHEGESDDAMFDRHLALAEPTATGNHLAAPYIRLIAHLHDGAIVGGFNLNTITRGLEWKADINWWVATPFAGRGLATEGVSAVVRFALADLPDGLGLHAVHAWITRDNVASARVAVKAGLMRAGEENSYVSTGGRWVLHDLYIVRASST